LYYSDFDPVKDADLIALMKEEAGARKRAMAPRERIRLDLDPTGPTQAIKGSEEKVAMMAERAAMNLPLFHPQDKADKAVWHDNREADTWHGKRGRDQANQKPREQHGRRAATCPVPPHLRSYLHSILMESDE